MVGEDMKKCQFLTDGFGRWSNFTWRPFVSGMYTITLSHNRKLRLKKGSSSLFFFNLILISQAEAYFRINWQCNSLMWACTWKCLLTSSDGISEIKTEKDSTKDNTDNRHA